MFRGTERLGPTDHMDLVRQAGGVCNAYTAFDQTVYHETLAAHQLELALWLEADRMSALKIDQTSFDTERKVVEEERRMRLNGPFGSVMEKVMAEVFQKHPYRWTPIGKIPHLRSAAVQELRDFWMRYYVPNNATLVIAGAVKHAEAQQLAKRHFSWIPRGPEPPRVKVEEPWPTAGRTVTIHEDNAPAPVVGVLFRTVPISHPDHVPLDLLTTILVGDDSSRLHRALVVEKKLAVQAIDISQSLEQEGIFFAGAIVPPFGAKPEAAMQELEAQIEKLRNGPITEHELTKARNQALALRGEPDADRAGQGLGPGARRRAGRGPQSGQRPVGRYPPRDDRGPATRRPHLPHSRATDQRQHSRHGRAGGAKKNSEEDAPITATPETQAPRPGRDGTTRPQGYFPAPPLAAPLDVEPPPLGPHHAQAR